MSCALTHRLLDQKLYPIVMISIPCASSWRYCNSGKNVVKKECERAVLSENAIQ